MARDFKTGLLGLCVRPPGAIAKAGPGTDEFGYGMVKVIMKKVAGKLDRECSSESGLAMPTFEQGQARLEEAFLRAEPAG